MARPLVVVEQICFNGDDGDHMTFQSLYDPIFLGGPLQIGSSVDERKLCVYCILICGHISSPFPQVDGLLWGLVCEAAIGALKCVSWTLL